MKISPLAIAAIGGIAYIALTSKPHNAQAPQVPPNPIAPPSLSPLPPAPGINAISWQVVSDAPKTVPGVASGNFPIVRINGLSPNTPYVIKILENGSYWGYRGGASQDTTDASGTFTDDVGIHSAGSILTLNLNKWPSGANDTPISTYTLRA